MDYSGLLLYISLDLQNWQFETPTASVSYLQQNKSNTSLILILKTLWLSMVSFFFQNERIWKSNICFWDKNM